MKSEITKEIEDLINWDSRITAEVVNKLISSIAVDARTIPLYADGNLALLYVISLLNDKVDSSNGR